MAEKDRHLRFNQEQSEILYRGPMVWNKWRADHPEAIIELEGNSFISSHLEGAMLNGAHLDGACFICSHLEGANLSGASLSRARLREATLSKVDLTGATLKEADLREADLTGADLSHTNLEGANLSYANLAQAKLHDANLIGTNFSSASLNGVDLSHNNLRGVSFENADLVKARLVRTNLEDANLTETNLEGANLWGGYLARAILRDAQLEGANFHDADLTSADLRGCKGLQLDSTIIRNARFSTNAPDLWSVLRRTYTGHRLTLNLLFFLAFITPFIAKTLFWIGVNKTQGASLRILARTSDSPLSEQATNYAQCLSANCNSFKVWELVMGLDQSPIFWSLTILLIVYNLCKIGLTWLVSALREEEDRSGHSPALNYSSKKNDSEWVQSQPDTIPLWRKFNWSYLLVHLWNACTTTYGWMIWPHRIVTTLFWVAVMAFLIHGYQWFGSTVSIPA